MERKKLKSFSSHNILKLKEIGSELLSFNVTEMNYEC